MRSGRWLRKAWSARAIVSSLPCGSSIMRAGLAARACSSPVCCARASRSRASASSMARWARGSLIPRRRGSQGLQHLRWPGAGVDASVPCLDLAILVDDHAHALRALGGIRVGAVGGADRAVRVADQGEVEVELLGELLVLRRGVEGHAQDHRVLLVVVGLEVAEPATLGGSAGGVGLGIEPEHDRLALEVGELDRIAVRIAAGEVRRLVAWIQHAYLLSASCARRARSTAGRCARAALGASIASGMDGGSAATRSFNGSTPSPGKKRPPRASRMRLGVSVGAGMSGPASHI